MVNQAVWSIKLIELLFFSVRSEFDWPNSLVYEAMLLTETVAKFGPQRNQANYTIISWKVWEVSSHKKSLGLTENA